MRLASACTIRSGYASRGAIEPSPFGLLAIQLTDFGVGKPLSPDHLTRSVFPSGDFLVGPGDILFRSRGQHTVATAIGTDFSEPAIAVAPLFIIRVPTDVLDPAYLVWWLNSPEQQRMLARDAQGQSVRMVSKAQLLDLAIEPPPLARQRLIVDAADLADREARLSSRLSSERHALAHARLSELVPTPIDRITR